MAVHVSMCDVYASLSLDRHQKNRKRLYNATLNPGRDVKCTIKC